MESMASHLQTRHEDETSDNSLSTLLSWAAVQKMGITSCPLCESSGPEDSPELVEHVLRHAYDFALRALPWPRPWVHDVNVPPGDFKPPNDSEQKDHLRRWIEEADHEGTEHPKLKLCQYDRKDHSDPSLTNVSEYSEYFVHNPYFGDMPEDRSSKPQAEPSTASTRSSARTDSDTGPVDAASIQRRCIPEFCIGTLDNPPYLPLSRFPHFLRKDRVMATLRREPYFARYGTDELERLVRYSEKNPKVFLTLSMGNLTRKMPSLMSKSFEDAYLPVWLQRENGKTTNYHVYSKDGRSEMQYFGELEGDMMYSWHLTDVQMFVTSQWTFCAIVFGPDFVLDLDLKRAGGLYQYSPLPLVDLGSKTTAKGKSGMMIRAGLCAEHDRIYAQYLTEVSTITWSNLGATQAVWTVMN